MDALREMLEKSLSHSYEFERELTGGGMSRVFVALERALGRRVVIKVLPPELAAGVNIERFRREIQLSAQLSHPHIVPVLASGEIGDLLYYTMPFIEGESLNTALQRGEKFETADVARILHDVVDALAYAHSRGVIHRDIKPANILTQGNHFLVTDFGVAKAITASITTTGLTSGGFAIGTPAYMAPEQLAADPNADHRVDIYAIGLLAYELLTGASPFTGTSPQAVMAAQLTRVPEPLLKVRPEVDPAFSDIVQQCLEKLPENRPATALALLAELDGVSSPSGAFKRRRPTLRAVISHPGRYRSYFSALLALVVAAVTGTFVLTTVIVNKAQAGRTTVAAGEDAGRVVVLENGRRVDQPAGAKLTTDMDSSAHAAMTAGRTIEMQIAAVELSEEMLSSMRDSIYEALAAEFRRDSVALSDSLRSLIRTVGDSLMRIAAARRGGGGGGRGGRGSSLVGTAPLGFGEKRVLVMDLSARLGRPDSTGLARALSDSLRAAIAGSTLYSVVDARLVRNSTRSENPMALATFVTAGAVIDGAVEMRRSGRVSVRLSLSEPSRAQAAVPLASTVVPVDSIFSAVQSLLPETLDALSKVTSWPAGGRGGRRGGGGGRGDAGAAGRVTGDSGEGRTGQAIPPRVPPDTQAGAVRTRA